MDKLAVFFLGVCFLGYLGYVLAIAFGAFANWHKPMAIAIVAVPFALLWQAGITRAPMDELRITYGMAYPLLEVFTYTIFCCLPVMLCLVAYVSGRAFLDAATDPARQDNCDESEADEAAEQMRLDKEADDKYRAQLAEFYLLADDEAYQLGLT